ncbi:MAG: DUF4169 family protein [Pseudomonadota bacterium]
MPAVINLNRARKQKLRADAEKLAAENRVKFGRTKLQKQRDRMETLDAQRRLDLLKRDIPAD